MFRKILVANRGEIACRVMRTAARMGIRTVAVYSEADRDARHVLMADEAVMLGPPPPSQSYLAVDAIVRAARKTGADAVHPGYGFLSENPALPRRLKRHHIVFIGPGAKAMAAMGDKIAAKRLAARAGVSTIPGHDGAVDDATAAVHAARRLGYPVMLKAAAGGGGKGMRIARTDAETREGFRAATREATAAFGDGRLLVERFVERPRHIEIQILADAHGNVISLGERECSIQRRHQKVVEESPSPFIDAKTRVAMGEQAKALARAVGYVSTGTVEFVVDCGRNFYFLEMNTRLQVEHPVTEMVAGLDLVEHMIRIAAGEPLALTQDEVRLEGWAIEARVYAEDPLRGFLPSVGRLTRYVSPPEGAGLRVDTGVGEGDEISIYYDPMIAKVVAHGASRAAALSRLRGALDAFHIRGVRHNIAFLAAVVGHPRFADGRLDTGFIAEVFPNGFRAADVPHPDPALVAAIAVAMHRAYHERSASVSGQLSGHPKRIPDRWVVLIGERAFEATAARAEDGFDVVVGGRDFRVCTNWRLAEPIFRARVNDEPVCLQVERAGIGYRIMHAGLDVQVNVMTPSAAAYRALVARKSARGASREVRSPMPGMLQSLAVAEGQEVRIGDELAVIEAMKMENVLKADRDGVVAAVHARPGAQLAADQVILEFREAS